MERRQMPSNMVLSDGMRPVNLEKPRKAGTGSVSKSVSDIARAAYRQGERDGSKKTEPRPEGVGWKDVFSKAAMALSGIGAAILALALLLPGHATSPDKAPIGGGRGSEMSAPKDSPTIPKESGGLFPRQSGKNHEKTSNHEKTDDGTGEIVTMLSENLFAIIAQSVGGLLLFLGIISSSAWIPLP